MRRLDASVNNRITKTDLNTTKLNDSVQISSIHQQNSSKGSIYDFSFLNLPDSLFLCAGDGERDNETDMRRLGETRGSRTIMNESNTSNYMNADLVKLETSERGNNFREPEPNTSKNTSKMLNLDLTNPDMSGSDKDINYLMQRRELSHKRDTSLKDWNLNKNCNLPGSCIAFNHEDLEGNYETGSSRDIREMLQRKELEGYREKSRELFDPG